ncbi:MAG: hypothetical protein IJE02_04355 [Clostridia bacterium]|nr:hypothetical protein [Clostridia bacterium]
MKQIETKKLDELHSLILELSCISYLQGIIQYENYSMLDGSNEIWEDAKNYLIDKEGEIVEKLKVLTQSNDFSFTLI